MYEDEMKGHVGHSNDSLFASADEMAGNYSPHTPNGFTPTRYTPTSSASRWSIAQHLVDEDDMALNYPMPDEPEIWKQAEHPDSINKLLNTTGDICQETFKGAAKMLSHANPDTFLMPLEARFICMKVDREADMRYCLANGGVTNLPACNERINKVWRERNGQKVFMMFSISGQKEFCAMAEMLGPVQPGKMPGWSKPGCVGIILITFIFVKNVPFALINHIKHKSNKQPVANMWNSMMYHDNTGYHVARIYCEHPVLSSVLVKVHTETHVNYKAQLRIPTSGNSAYSASSYGSHNAKHHDPRSATQVSIHRSGGRNQRNMTGRHVHHTPSWRNDMPPTPSRAGDYHAAVNSTPTPGPMQTPSTLQRERTVARATQSPPHFELSDDLIGSGSGVVDTARSFTTADERMLARFASSRDAKRSESSQTPNSFQQAEYSIQDPFRVGRTPYDGEHHTSYKMHGVTHDVRGDHYQASRHDVQWQSDGRAAQVPVFMDNSSSGLGITSKANGSYNHQIQQPTYNKGKAPHLPSPVTSSQSSRQDIPSLPSGLRKQHSQAFALPSPPSFSTMRSTRGHCHGHPVLQSRSHATQGKDDSHDGHQHAAKPGNPIKHSQSMPAMMQQVTRKLSAHHLRAHNASTKTDDANNVGPSSPSIQEWVARTPTRTNDGKHELPAPMALTVKTATNFTQSPEKPVNSADMADRLKWHKASAVALEIEVRMAQASDRPLTEKEDLIKWHNAKAACLEVEIAAARREHEEACGELVKETAKIPPASPSTAHNSADWPRWTNGSSAESSLVAPEVDEGGKIIRSLSKDRDGKAVHVGQKLRHRRGDINNEGFTGSFDARINANVEELISSPTRARAYPADQVSHIHGHPKKHDSKHAHGQYDSCTDEHRCHNAKHFHYDDIDDASDLASQVASLEEDEEDDEDFSPRGRGYHHSSPSRDDSQVSYNGGIRLGDGRGHK